MTFRTALRATGKPQLRVVDGGRNDLTPEHKEALIEQYKDEVRQLRTGRHTGFYDCALKLFGLGLPDHELDWHLHELERDMGREHKHEAKGAMASIRK